MTDHGQRLDTIERVRLANLPTPIVEAPRLAEHAGLARLMIKRDDMTGLAFGGNKARKLEYDLAGGVRLGCDVLVTIGGTQSNHAVMTAAAARRLGLGVKLVLGGPDFARFDGNLLLDVVYGPRSAIWSMTMTTTPSPRPWTIGCRSCEPPGAGPSPFRSAGAPGRGP